MALKIKDNVELRELEKYGFTPNGMSGLNNTVYSKRIIEKDNFYSGWEDTLIISEPTREIRYRTCDDGYWSIPNCLFDIIQAGLVEKVEE